MATHTHTKTPIQPQQNTGHNVTVSDASAVTPAAPAATAPAPTAAAPAAPVASAPAPNPVPPTPLPPSGPGLVKPPPNVTIPAPPVGFVPANPKDYRGFRPKSSELAVVPDAVVELASFTDYSAVFGMTAPPVGDLTQTLGASQQWTSLLADSSDWERYVKSQEGMAWMTTLTLMDKLKAPFALASAHDPTLNSRYPALARLLGAAKVIAKRGAATKARTKAAAAGKPATAKAKKAAAAAAVSAAAAAAHPAAPAAPAVPTAAPPASPHTGA
jgi:hypothetical protein